VNVDSDGSRAATVQGITVSAKFEKDLRQETNGEYGVCQEKGRWKQEVD